MERPRRPAQSASLKDLTESYIDDALRHTGGRIGGDDGAAALLNVHPNTLRVRRQKKKQTDGA